MAVRRKLRGLLCGFRLLRCLDGFAHEPWAACFCWLRVLLYVLEVYLGRFSKGEMFLFFFASLIFMLLRVQKAKDK